MKARVSAIVPAYNEAERIGIVLGVLTTYSDFAEVIVVDDGSTDATGEVAQQFAVRYVRLSGNLGKGIAMERGVACAKGDTLFFCDADIRGLTHDILRQTLAPVIRGEVDMFIAMCERKIYPPSFRGEVRVNGPSEFHTVPLLSGERALTKRLWNRIPDYYKHQFRIEVGLNFYAKNYGKGYRYQVFSGLKQTIKEKKYGWREGVWRRLGFFRDLVQAYSTLTMEKLLTFAKN